MAIAYKDKDGNIVQLPDGIELIVSGRMGEKGNQLKITELLGDYIVAIKVESSKNDLTITPRSDHVISLM